MREGDVLGGRYRLAGLVAVGGMGEVWRADDETLGRQVAVKVLKAEYAEDPTFVERFRAEARNTAMLSHSGIATVYDYGEVSVDEGGSSNAYLVMELVPGQPLSALLAAEGPLAPDRTMHIVGQAALALQAAHEAGVVHRDIKPGNVLVTGDDTVKITDFGIARAADAVPLTRTGTVLGTAFYLSPEQAAGDDVGPASDIYSLGIVAYECLSGRRPFAGTNPVAVALAHQREQAPPLPPEIPRQVQELVGRAMAKNPPDRPPTAGEFGRAALALRDGLQGTRPMPAMGMPPTSRMAGTRPAGTAVLPRTGAPPGRPGPPPPRPPARRSRNLRAPLIGLLLLALLIGGFALFRGLDGSGGSDTPSAAPSASASTVNLDPDDYIGDRLGDVRSRLSDLGLAVTVSGSPDADSRVTSISPTGEVAKGRTITVTTRSTETSAPTQAPTSAPETEPPSTPSPTRSSAAPQPSSSGGSGSDDDSGGGNGNGGSGNGGGGGGGLDIPGVGGSGGN